MPTTDQPTPPVTDAAMSAEDERAAEIFITPRVIDQGAFTTYSQSLRGLIEDSGRVRRDLDGMTAQSRQVAEGLRKVLSELKERMETSVRLVPTLDQRSERAEALVARAERAIAEPERLASEMAARVRALVEESTRAIEAAAGEAGGRIEEEAGEVAYRVDRAAAAARESAEAAEAGAGRLDEARAQGEAVAAELERVLGEARGIVEREGPGSLKAMLAEGAALRAGVEAATKAAREAGQLAEQAEIARRALAEAILDGTARADAVEARKDEILRALESAAETISQEGPGIEQHLESMEARTRRLAEEGRALAEQMEHVQRGADAAAETLGRAERAAEGAAEAGRAMPDAEALAGDVAERAAKILEERLMAGFADRLEARARAAIEPWGARVEEMGAWLGTLITRAERVQRELESMTTKEDGEG